MIASFLLLAETLFRDRLAAWARSVHIFSFIVLAWAWLAPLAARGYAAWARRRRAPRVSLWVCACGNASPLDILSCGKCAATRKMDWGEAWEASPAGKTWGRLCARTGAAVRGAGVAAYVLFPAWVFFLLDAHRLGGGALRELFCGLAVVAAVATVVLAGRAAAAGTGILARGALLLAAATMAGLTLLCMVLWTAAPYPPSHPIASVRLFPDGRVTYTGADGRALERSGALQENAVEFHVQSAFLSWPMMRVRQTYPLSIGNVGIVEPWVSELLTKAARKYTADGPHRLRVALRGDTLFAPPGGPYQLREAQDGAGLVLVNPDEQR